jgi:cell fate (sporulation/competence/biofilm development) regulator YlbF (YheA/YmcA/DUF963 family)
MSVLEEKSKELGRLIGQSSEYSALKRANEGLGSDQEAVRILDEMEKLRARAHELMSRGQEPGADIEQRLDELLQQAQQNSSYQRMVVAQENFDKLMAAANGWILDGIRKGAASPIITLS